MTNALKIETFPYYFAIAKIRNPASINWKSPFVFVGKTDDELSLVALESEVPSDAYPVDRGYRMMRVAGTLDMSLTGILARSPRYSLMRRSRFSQSPPTTRTTSW